MRVLHSIGAATRMQNQSFKQPQRRNLQCFINFARHALRVNPVSHQTNCGFIP